MFLRKIEAVFDLNDTGEMEDVLEQLQQYGGAKVVERYTITETFEQASKILDKRGCK